MGRSATHKAINQAKREEEITKANARITVAQKRIETVHSQK